VCREADQANDGTASRPRDGPLSRPVCRQPNESAGEHARTRWSARRSGRLLRLAQQEPVIGG
jgi:hypothetical protein